MCSVGPLTIAGWHTVIATVMVVVFAVGYGELRARDLWLTVLTVVVAMRCRMYGEPVFKRLPNGRVRFTWGIPQLLGHAQRRAERLDRTYRRTVTVNELLAREQTLKGQLADVGAAADTAPDSPTPRPSRPAGTPPRWE
ncbi:MAG: hypothetical protein ACRDRZ_18845 [Pseudonocardiaceae bacterium]